MMDKTNILKQNNAFLVEKCFRLENDKSTGLTSVNKRATYRKAAQVNIQAARGIDLQQQQQSSARPPIIQSAVQWQKITRIPLIRSNSKYSGISDHLPHQEQNINHESPGCHNPYKNTKKIENRVSSESGLKEFTGNERRLWIYLYRVKKTATEDMITYISSKPG